MSAAQRVQCCHYNAMTAAGGQWHLSVVQSGFFKSLFSPLRDQLNDTNSFRRCLEP